MTDGVRDWCERLGWRCAREYLGDTEGGKLVLELLKLLVEVSLALALLAKLEALYFSCIGTNAQEGIRGCCKNALIVAAWDCAR